MRLRREKLICVLVCACMLASTGSPPGYAQKPEGFADCLAPASLKGPEARRLLRDMRRLKRVEAVLESTRVRIEEFCASRAKDKAALSQQFSEYREDYRVLERFFNDPTLNAWWQGQGGLEGKRIVDVTPSFGAFAVQAARRGAIVTVLAAGPAHERILRQALEDNPGLDITIRRWPERPREVLEGTGFDIVHH